MLRKLFLFGCCLIAMNAYAQLGGTGTYNFLYMQPGARVAALGGSAINNPATDLNLVLQNPALLNSDFDKQIAFSYVKYFADISAGYAGFAKHFDSLHTTFATGIQFVNYGNFTKMSPDGQEIGTFSAGEYNFHVSASRIYKQFQYGASMKFIYSSLETYSSIGVATDLAATYFSKDRLTMVSAVLANAGTQLKTYTNETKEPIPMNLQLGFSRKFEHNPLRLGVIAQHLESPGQLLYQIDNRNNKNIDLETGLPIPEHFSVLNHVMSHLIINTEVVFSKNFSFRFGYNDLRRRELALTDRKGLSGYSWGFGLKINRFQINYGSGSYLVGKNTNHLSIITNISEFTKRKKVNQE